MKTVRPQVVPAVKVGPRKVSRFVTAPVGDRKGAAFEGVPAPALGVY